MAVIHMRKPPDQLYEQDYRVCCRTPCFCSMT